MQPPHNQSRINLAELKAQLVKKLGPEGSKQYFYYLNRFLSLKLNKAEFNKLCLRIVGRENIPLHNQLIRSILRNACTAKTPPTISQKDDLKPAQQNGSHSGSQVLPNGNDILPLSPKKARTGNRGRPRSALGPNGKASFVPQLPSHLNNVVLENGDLNQVEDSGKEGSSRSPLRAPLGVQFYPVGGANRASSSSLNDIALLDSVTLREKMEQIALLQGLEGVSLDCANILNHGLDTYLKGLIRSCIELVGSRSGQEAKLINGVKPGHQYHQMQRKALEQKNYGPISMQDFRVAMELNPQKLGEDWPLLLEKICTHSFEE